MQITIRQEYSRKRRKIPKFINSNGIPSYARAPILIDGSTFFERGIGGSGVLDCLISFQRDSLSWPAAFS